MRHVTRGAAAIFLVVLWFSPTVQSQVSFPVPPAYSGHGDIFVADFNGDGKPDLLSPVDGVLELGNGDGTFTLGAAISDGALAVGDFNGDGNPDVLQQGTGTLLVLLGNGDGTFKPAITSPSGASLLPIAAGDLNGDGKADVIGIFNGVLMVYLSKGDGTFASRVPYNIGSQSGNVLTIGDFNGDKKADIVVSTGSLEIVLLGNGNGTFQAAITSPSVGLNHVVAGDFNGDGKLDLLVSATNCGSPCGPSGTTYFLAGKGDGTFKTAIGIFPDSAPLAAADVNGDGKLDLLVESFPATGQVFLGNGDGTFLKYDSYILNFTQSVPFPAEFSTGVAVSDFNGDGKMDVVMGYAVLLGNGNGTFQGIRLGLTPGGFFHLAVGSFDKNGPTPGVAVLSNPVGILRNDGGGVLSLTHTYTLQEPGFAIVASDFDGDGNLDLFVVSVDSSTQLWSYSVLLGNGDGTFRPPAFVPEAVPAKNASIVVGDFNGDHKMDIAIGGMGNQTLALLMGNGDGTFAAPAYVFDAGGGGFSLLAADYNGDGKLDIVAGNELLLGNGDGTFQAAIIPSGLEQFSPTLTADLNNDGTTDLIGQNHIALGNGDGTFRLSTLNLSTVNSSEVSTIPFVAADVNGDGKPDLFVEIFDQSDRSSAQTGFSLGNGDGTFGPIINVPPKAPFGGVLTLRAVADMNADGRPDLIVSSNGGVAGVGIIFNTTAPGFTLTASTLSPATITPGNSTTSTIGVTPTFGFTGAVVLSCTGLPSGATCQFSPASLPSGSGSSALVLTSAMSTAAGTYPVQIEGTSGSLTTSAALSLVVQAAPDFELAGTPTSLTVTAGQNANFSLAVTPKGSFVGAVNLSCSVTPAVTRAPTCSLSNSSVQINANGAASVTLTVGTAGSTPAVMQPRVELPRLLPVSILLKWAVILLTLAWLLPLNQKRRLIPAWLLIVLVALASSGCGGGSSQPSHTTVFGTPSGTYTIAVSASSGSLTHTTTLNVVVQ